MLILVIIGNNSASGLFCLAVLSILSAIMQNYIDKKYILGGKR